MLHSEPLINSENVSVLDEEAVHLLPFSKEELRALLCRMLKGASLPSATLELLCVRDGTMAQLNQQHMGRNGPTNILSFPSGETVQEGAFLGSLVLSADTLLREAQLYRVPGRRYCLDLLAHGLAHLAGFEHGPQMDRFAHLLFEQAASQQKNTY